MLKYDRLMERLNAFGMSKSVLREHGFSPNLIYKLQRGEHVNTINIDKLCKLLQCQPGDLMEYIPDKTDAE